MAHPSYFVVMIDYGRRGREAVVDPETTRRGIVAHVRDILSKTDGRTILFIHEIVDFGDGHRSVYDVTDELIEEALDVESDPIDHQALAFDHAHDLRKHEERV